MQRFIYSHRSIRSWCIALVLASVGLPAAFADWPGFLGPGGNPVISQSDLPLEFQVGSDDQPSKNIAWRVPLKGRSVSGPIIVGGKVITSSSSAMEGRWIHLAAVDAESGELLWQRSNKATGRPFCHPTSANAAPTPCSDGQRVFAFYSSNDLVCYDLDGNLQWFRSLTDEHPLAGNDVGMSSSPVVIDGVVVVTVECQADSFTAGFDADTGKTLWEVQRPRTANWASPRVITSGDGRPVIVIHGRRDMVGIDPRTGDTLWRLEQSCSSMATAVFANDLLYVPTNGTQVFELPTADSKPVAMWRTSRINPSSTSPLVSSVGLLGLNRSILVCCDQEGDLRWQARLRDAGQFWATPVVSGKHLYAFAMSGKCFTVELSEDEAEVVAESELGSEVLGSPAIANDALYVRSVDALWKIAKSN